MIISDSPEGGLNVFKDATVVCGMSHVFSRALDRAYSPAPFDPLTELCHEERAGRLIRRTDEGRISFDFAAPPEIVAHVSRQVIPVNLNAPDNYFHFMVEWLPSLIARIVEGCLPKKVLIVTGILHVNMWEPLRLLTTKWRLPVLQLGGWQAISCDYAIQLRPSYHTVDLISGGIKPPAYDAYNLRILRNALKGLCGGADANGPRKLFIRRKSHVRHISNAEEIEALAAAAGYHVVDPAALTFMDQIRLFSGATRIVGPTGAWLANLACSPQGARVSVFMPDTVVAPGGTVWIEMGKIFGVEISEHYCPVTDFHEKVIHSDYMVPRDLAMEVFSG